MMILVSDDNTLMSQYNTDIQHGLTVEIPTMIIPKHIGEIFKEYLLTEQTEKIILSVKFSGAQEGNAIDIDLYFRSDDVRALSFFKEFEYFFEKLGDKLSLNPIYKYTKYVYGETDDSLDPNLDAPCVKEDHYCTGANHELHVYTPRYILMENIRQSCIFKLNSLKVYWNYMITFLELCADLNNPAFNEECSKNVLKSIHIFDTYSSIVKCMENMINENSKIELDYAKYDQNKIFKVPELVINGVKYRENWNGKHIFNFICSGFIENDEVCVIPKEEPVSSNFGIILGVVLFLLVLMIVLLMCYRRIVHKSLEATLNEKIQKQTLHSIGQYRVFKEDKETGRKTVDGF